MNIDRDRTKALTLEHVRSAINVIAELLNGPTRRCRDRFIVSFITRRINRDSHFKDDIISENRDRRVKYTPKT